MSDLPAFPHPHGPNHWPGLTIRDYFAAMALQGQIAHDGSDYSDGGMKIDVKHSYEYADAMLAEREKETDND